MSSLHLNPGRRYGIPAIHAGTTSSQSTTAATPES